ncbi:MAG: M1 family peptidase [Saprospiraceae bacterium]|nr:M1 family peptidase [Saprospiraceae bacterium]
MNKLLFFFFLVITQSVFAQYDSPERNKFGQLETMLPTANSYRTASGAPGSQYWQQQADYKIKVELDDANQKIFGDETITYINNSPDELSYLWLQLDQNIWSKDSDTYKARTSSMNDKMSPKDLKGLMPSEFDGGYKLEFVQDMNGGKLNYTINKTMMRLDLPKSLKKGESYSFKIKWWYNINDRAKIGGRSGYEYFSEDNNYLYTIAQFFPRMCVYSDVTGWQNKQFLGSGEFTLPFGNYEVSLTVPADHLVAATGVLQNPKEVMDAEHIRKFDAAKKSLTDPVIIYTQKEAEEREKQKSSAKKTWIFKAENVRDFAFASSRKFIWDAMGVQQSDGRVVLAMSMYPKEGNPLWEKYSTKAVAHTLRWYSHYTFDYPYPCAWSINADNIGMEYPMICFNFGRCEKDGTYTERDKYGVLGVIIHEVGHNYFPMIVNSDERQWTWMDEGLNTFIQYLAEQQWERDFPSGRGPANKIVDYMKGDKSRLEPIMTNSESLIQFGSNAYAKTATALNILRETVMGRELFDHAFKTYANRWKFKHPSPADFFRTMEDASAVDLDWFWRGWFYSTDNVDLALDKVRILKLDSKNPEVEKAALKKEKEAAPKNMSDLKNKEIKQTQDEIDPKLVDFYTTYDPLDVTNMDKEEYQKYYSTLTKEEKELLEAGYYFNEITVKRIGGLVMPVIIELEFLDGTKELHRIPAEIWRYDNKEAKKVFVTKKEVKQVSLDPYLETADIDTSNNYFPPKSNMSRFELFKNRTRGQGELNPMQKAKKN